jgi:hypothetical protein
MPLLNAKRMKQIALAAAAVPVASVLGLYGLEHVLNSPYPGPAVNAMREFILNQYR